ncbi:hypothetical protein V1294_006059 [Bradyrhizobium sp. AZCC 1678]|uniref:hypothetical protein n=1 Tax=Bradyrhizobium sp. AZCC 1678 TaxID=3117030 RepID=UPI002FF2CE43
MAGVKLEQGAYGGPGIAAARLDRCIVAVSTSAASSAGWCSAGADISMIPGLTGNDHMFSSQRPMSVIFD